MHVYRIKTQQKEATKTIISFVNNTEYSFPKQSNENKKTFPMQW